MNKGEILLVTPDRISKESIFNLLTGFGESAIFVPQLLIMYKYSLLLILTRSNQSGYGRWVSWADLVKNTMFTDADAISFFL